MPDDLAKRRAEKGVATVRVGSRTFTFTIPIEKMRDPLAALKARRPHVPRETKA